MFRRLNDFSDFLSFLILDTEDPPVYGPHLLHCRVTFQLIDEPTTEGSEIIVDIYTLKFGHLSYLLFAPYDVTFAVSADKLCDNGPMFVASSPPSYSMANTHLLGSAVSPDLRSYLDDNLVGVFSSRIPLCGLWNSVDPHTLFVAVLF